MTEPKPKLRWFQYRLRTLLIFVSVVAVILSIISWYTHNYRLVEKQRSLTFAVAPCGGTVFYDNGYPEGYYLHPLPSLWYEAIWGPQHRIVAVDVGNGEHLEDDDIATVPWLSIRCILYDAEAIAPLTLQKLRQACPECQLVPRKARM